MTSAPSSCLYALVSEAEQAAVAAGAAQLSRALSEASGTSYVFDCVFVTEPGAVAASTPTPLYITSFFAEIDRTDETWAQTQDRLRAYYADLSERGWRIFLCTSFRSVTRVAAVDEQADRRLLTIRRLNLLAAKLSQEFGLFVVDLDRALADIGAQVIQTDYRLHGPAAAEIAGKTIALTVITNGLDDIAPFDLQDAAKVSAASYRPNIAGLGDRSTKLVASNVMAIGRGRRKQVAATRVETLQGRQADRLVSLFLKGQIGPKDAFAKVVAGVRNRGLGPSASLIAAGLVQAVRGRR